MLPISCHLGITAADHRVTLDMDVTTNTASRRHRTDLASSYAHRNSEREATAYVRSLSLGDEPRYTPSLARYANIIYEASSSSPSCPTRSMVLSFQSCPCLCSCSYVSHDARCYRLPIAGPSLIALPPPPPPASPLSPQAGGPPIPLDPA